MGLRSGVCGLDDNVAFREDSFDEENEVGGRFLKDVVDSLVGEGHARAANRERREGAFSRSR